MNYGTKFYNKDFTLNDIIAIVNALEVNSADDACSYPYIQKESSQMNILFDNGFEIQAQIRHHDMSYEERMAHQNERKALREAERFAKREEKKKNCVTAYNATCAAAMLTAGCRLVSFAKTVRVGNGFTDVYTFERTKTAQDILDRYINTQSRNKIRETEDDKTTV